MLLCGVVSRVRAGVCCVCGLTSRCVQHVVLHVAFLHACVFSVASYGVCVCLCVSFEDLRRAVLPKFRAHVAAYYTAVVCLKPSQASCNERAVRGNNGKNARCYRVVSEARHTPETTE